MRKNKGESDLRLIYVAFVVVVVTTIMAFNFYAIYTHCVGKNTAIPIKKSIWEENLEDVDALNMPKIIKEYLLRRI